MQATKYPRLARVIAAIEATGLTRAEIGRLAGRDGAQGTRWAKGERLPTWPAAKALADAIRPKEPGLADELLGTWHYYSDPVESEPGSSIPSEVLRVIRRNYSPRQQREAIEMLESLNAPRAGAESEPGEPRRAG